MKKLISFIIKAEFGFFKKPDINDKIFISYNMIHKPYIMGILGAIMGYGGYSQSRDNKQMPEYYEKLKNIRVAISPSSKNGGIFKKEFILFNNTTNKETANITEQTLINPAYKIYLEVDYSDKEHLKLVDNIKNSKSVYLPYMGKNEFSLWWDNFHEHKKFNEIKEKERFEIKSLIRKDKNFVLKNSGYKERTTNYFYLFERLPIGFDEVLKQYIYQDFIYTNAIFESSKTLNNLYESDEGAICLF